MGILKAMQKQIFVKVVDFSEYNDKSRPTYAGQMLPRVKTSTFSIVYTNSCDLFSMPIYTCLISSQLKSHWKRRCAETLKHIKEHHDEEVHKMEKRMRNIERRGTIFDKKQHETEGTIVLDYMH